MFAKDRKGQAINTLIAILIFVVVAVSAVIPTVNTAISDGNFTGTTATVLNQAPLLLAVLVLVVIVGPLRG